MKCLIKNFTKKSSLYSVNVRELMDNKDTYTVDEYRQRLYLFDDIVGQAGDPWQRNLFASILTGIPLGLFYITQDPKTGISKIEDGQQRFGTLKAILDGAVKLPNNMGDYGKDYERLSNRSFTHLKTLAPDQREYILNLELLFVGLKDMTEEQLSECFRDINNGTPLTSQEIRGAQYSFGSHRLHDLTQSLEISTLETSRRSSRRFAFLSTSVPVTGKYLEEVVAFWCDTHLENKIQSMKQSTLERRYKLFNEEGIIPSSTTTKSFKKFEEILSIVDKSIVTYVDLSKKKNQDFFGKRQLRFYFYVIRELMHRNIKVDNSSVVKNYALALAKLAESNELWTDPKKFDKQTGAPVRIFWNDLFNKRADEAHQIEYVVNQIVDMMVSQSSKFISRDKKREFSSDQKRVKYHEQDGKCFYCQTEIEMQDAIADHIIPHSKGGKTELDNCAISCKDCNTEKSSLDGKEYEMVLSSREVKQEPQTH